MAALPNNVGLGVGTSSIRVATATSVRPMFSGGPAGCHRTGSPSPPRSARCSSRFASRTPGPGSGAGEDWLQLGFRHNCWKHEEDLSIRYVSVSSLSLEAVHQSDWATFGPVTLDEILPHEHGCSHEIGFLDGSLTVVSRDLAATWTEADCPDKPSSS